MVNIGVIGIGKMGVSHLSILGAHPNVNIVGVADNSKMIVGVIERYSPFKCYTNHSEMILNENPQAVFVSTPTKFHYPMVKELLEKGIHVFVEKPFCLDSNEGSKLIEIADKNKLINQVGYHNKFIGTFSEANSIIKSGCIGELFHFNVEMYGPVVVKKKEVTWRSKADEGGGCLMDYAAHSIDLINNMVGKITKVEGVLLKSIYSKNVEDGVYALLRTENDISGVLNVNWSDETFRKMSTSFTILGTKGKIIVDNTELKIFLKESIPDSKYSKGWNIIHINELCENVDFYLRGEEYSAQVAYFIDTLERKKENNVNTFKSAWETDRVIEMIKNYNTINNA
jgi:predicted dehydrogenase